MPMLLAGAAAAATGTGARPPSRKRARPLKGAAPCSAAVPRPPPPLPRMEAGATRIRQRRPPAPRCLGSGSSSGSNDGGAALQACGRGLSTALSLPHGRLVLLGLLLLSRLVVQYAFPLSTPLQQPQHRRPQQQQQRPPPPTAAQPLPPSSASRVRLFATTATGFTPPPPPAGDGSTGGGQPHQPQQPAAVRKRASPPPPMQPSVDLATVQSRISKGGPAGLERALFEMRQLRRSSGRPLPDQLYREFLDKCRHRNGPRAYATRLLPLAQEAAQLYLLDAAAAAAAATEGGAGQAVLLPVREMRDLVKASARAKDPEGTLALLRALIAQSSERGGAAGPAAEAVGEQAFFLAIRCCADAAAAAATGGGGAGPHFLDAIPGLLAEMTLLNVPKTKFVCSAALTAFARAASPEWLPHVEVLAAEMLLPRRDRVGGGGKQAPAADLVAVNSLLDAYASCGALPKARALLEDMAAAASASSSSSSTNSTATLAAAAAARLLPAPDAFSYNIVLRALGQQGQVGAALALYRQMQARDGAGARPDAVTINTLVAACTQAGNFERALLILESSSVPASVEGYSALVHGLAAKGDGVRVQTVLQAMAAAGIAPNVRTYASMLRGAAGAGDVAKVKDLLRMMHLQGEMDPKVRPTAWAYNAALGPLVRKAQLQPALELWEEMKAAGVAPDVVTCNTLLDGLLKAEPPRMPEAEALFLDMLEQGPGPDSYTFATLLRAYQPPPPPKPRMPRSPVDLLQRLPGALLGVAGGVGGGEADGEGDGATAAGAADGAGDGGGSGRDILPGPERLLEMARMPREGAGTGPRVLLDTTAVNTLLMAFMRGGAVKQALEVFEDFKRGNLTTPAAAAEQEDPSNLRPGRPDVVTYTVLVKGVAQSNNMYAGSKIMSLYREMRGQYGLKPDLQLAYALVNSFVRAQSRVGGLEWADLEEVFADLRALGWRGDTLTGLEQRASTYQGMYSEAWKERGGQRAKQPQQQRNRPETTSEKLFRKYNWNRIDSGLGFF